MHRLELLLDSIERLCADGRDLCNGRYEPRNLDRGRSVFSGVRGGEEGAMQRTGLARMKAWVMVAAFAATGLLVGCHAESSKDGAAERLKLSSPFGGLQLKVKTDEDAAGTGTGVPIYPGALLVRNGKGKDSNNGTADINLSFGSMRLRLEVLSYETKDSPDQVRSFYGKELGRFGTVIACANEHAVGLPVRTPEGLTCDKDSNEKSDNDKSSEAANAIELKAGSPQHQHAVSIEKSDAGTKFALIRIDLPKRFTIGDDHASGETTQ